MTVHEHFLTVGQSLSIGTFGSPRLSVTAEHPTNSRTYRGTDAPDERTQVNVTNQQLAPYGGSERSEFQANFKLYEYLQAMGGANANRVIGSNTFGVGGAPYVELKKNPDNPAFTNYELSRQRFQQAKDALAAQGNTLRGSGLLIVHGEGDLNAGTTRRQYKLDLLEWRNDYDADWKGITGQSQDLQAYLVQTNTWNDYDKFPLTALSQIDVHRESALHHLIGPAYHLPYHNPDPTDVNRPDPPYAYYIHDGIHLTNVGYFHLGEYFARVIHKVANLGQTWNPLMPYQVTRAQGSSIVVAKFYVPTPPLVFNTTAIPAVANYGFKYLVGTQEQTIVSITFYDATTVLIELADAPVGGRPETLAYGTVGNRTGNLCDSETEVSKYVPPGGSARVLQNWCVQFYEPVDAVQSLVRDGVQMVRTSTRVGKAKRIPVAAYYQSHGVVTKVKW